MKMTTEEAFIKVLQMHGIEHAFGIIGSAMMPSREATPCIQEPWATMAQKPALTIGPPMLPSSRLTSTPTA